MSKYLKNLLTDHLKSRLDGVSDVLVVDVMGLKSNTTVELRKKLYAILAEGDDAEDRS